MSARTRPAKRPARVFSDRPRPRETAVGHVTGLALTLAAGAMLASAVVQVIDGRGEPGPLFGSALLVGLPGLALWRRTVPPDQLARGSIFAAVLMSWLAISLAGTIPYLWADVFDRFDLALFESVSGFTTTGSTVLRPIEGTPNGILFFRATTQWMGGIGVVVLAVSVLTYLRVGGLDLLDAEAPGPVAERLVPRVRETAKRLVSLYVVFTTIVATGYAVAGMSPYDAVVHAFTTVSTGGYSPYNLSFAQFDSAPLEWIAIAAMVFAGGSFALYWQAFTGKPVAVLRSTEFRAYIAIIGSISGAAVVGNIAQHGLDGDIIRRTIFSTISITSSTGYTSLDYGTWAPSVQLLLVFAMGLGGMAGSTTGGFKVFRLLTVLSQGRRQVFAHLHPHAVPVVRFGRQIVPTELASRVTGFFAAFMAIGAGATLLVAAFGADIQTSISSVAQALGNVGPGLGDVGPTTDFLGLSAGGRAVVMLAMLVGRLEVFPILLGFVGVARFVGDRLPRRTAQVLLRMFRG